MDRWRRDGHEVAIIGNGARHFAEAFRQDMNVDVPIYVDPERHAYRAVALRRGGLSTMSPRLLKHGVRAFRRGARQTGVHGDALQLGGAFVIAPDGAVHLAQRSREAGDHASEASIDAALRAASSGTPATLAEDAIGARGGMLGRLRPWRDASPVGSFDGPGFTRHAAGFAPDAIASDLRGRRCLITGASSGIGFAAARALADRGAELLLLSRDAPRGEGAADRIRRATGNDDVAWSRLDVSDLSDVRRAAGALAEKPVHMLVHNAGAMHHERRITADGLELTFATHVAGPHVLTRRLSAALHEAPDARVVWVSSGGMLTKRLSVDDPHFERRPYDGVNAYAETKRAQVVMAARWAEELERAGVSVTSMHPGWVDTPAVRDALPRFYRTMKNRLRTPEQGADTIVWLCASKAPPTPGAFYFDREAVRAHWLPITRASADVRTSLWNLCEAYAEGSSSAA